MEDNQVLQAEIPIQAQAITVWEQVGITNDFIFKKVMENPEICKKVLETILGVKIQKLVYIESEKELDVDYHSKSIRFDVYAENDEHTVYNVEMQVIDTKELPKRTRYYQSIIDVNLLQKGLHYKELTQSYIIFICLFDIFKKGRHRYTFENICIEDHSVPLQDNTQKIFLNAVGILDDVEENLRIYLDYIAGKPVQSELVTQLDYEVEKIKQSSGRRTEFMTLYMRDQENIELGKELGKEEGIKALIETLQDFSFTSEQIVSKLMEKLQIDETKAYSYLQ